MKIDKGFLKSENKLYIAYRHYRNNNQRVVVIAPGFFNSKDSELLGLLGDKLSKENDVFMFDFRGHGKSSGLFTWTSNEANDLKAVLGFLKGKYEKTAVIGFSLGGSTSINVLSENKYKVDSFIGVSVPSDFEKIDYKWWQLDWKNDIVYSMLTKGGRQGKGVKVGAWWLPKQKPIDNVSKLNMPILYVHGEKDWVVEMRHSENLYEKTNTKKDLIIIENGPHAEYLLRKHNNIFYEAINSWLDETL